MATTRKILSKGIIKQSNFPASAEKLAVPKIATNEKIPAEIESQSGELREEGKRGDTIRSKKICQFCSNKTEPHYFDMVALRRFLNDRGRIITRVRSGSCAKHQRRITKEIKRARHLALLPFTVKV